jgi:tetratricopeptide (TPR) repeat protein
MASNPSTTHSAPPEPASVGLRIETAEALLGLVLGAYRAGNLGELLRSRPRAARRLLRRFIGPVLGAAGNALPADQANALCTTFALRWLAERMRPDGADGRTPVDRSAWLDRTSWRPLLAVMCHYGLEPVPAFPDRYRRRADESAADNLCGLWSVGTSTFYRYLEKGKRQMAERWLSAAVSGADRLSLRRTAQRLVHDHAPAGAEPAVGTFEWHRQQGQSAAARRDATDALWHSLACGDVDAFVDHLRRFRIELARDPEVDPLVAAWADRPLAHREAIELLVADADLMQTRRADERARLRLEEALRRADAADDPVLLGIVYGALGKFHESRDTDKALACLQDSAEFLRRAQEDGRPGAFDVYVAALQRLAWFHVLRNDPRSRLVLDRAQAMLERSGPPARLHALLEQTWGEYWRRAGDLNRAIEHKHLALNVFERLGDVREILSTYNNLSLLYVETKRYDLAESHARRVVDRAESATVDPYILTSALGNLGIALFWQERHDEAIEQYRKGLAESLRADLPVIANRARYNLAEAHYKKFLVSGDPEDERLGDAEIRLVLSAPAAERDAWFQEAAPALKSEILGADHGHVHERLWPEESVAHFEEMSEIQKHRALLAMPSSAESRVRIHLALARTYVAIAMKEHERAMDLAEQSGLTADFQPEFDGLQLAMSRERTKESALRARWRKDAGSLLSEQRSAELLRHLIDAGSINKSGYAELCQCGLATASKHLGLLAERGLLVQTGKGPSTRYVLP